MYKDRMRELRLFSDSKRTLWGWGERLSNVYKYLMGGYKKDESHVLLSDTQWQDKR